MPEEESMDIKFRLDDASDIGTFRYSAASTVDFLKQSVVSDWPKDMQGWKLNWDPRNEGVENELEMERENLVVEEERILTEMSGL